MTTTQLHVFNGIYLIVFIVAAILTRATRRRILGALLGGLVVGLLFMPYVALGEKAGWWHFTIPWEPYFLAVMAIGFPMMGFIPLITWRIARRFGPRGLALAVLFAAIIGPPRDFFYMKMFPEWGYHAPGIAPIVAISAAYAAIVLVGHGVMRLVAGPADADPLARRPWESA